MVQSAPRESLRALRARRQILRAASPIFRRKGLHATGMRDIAAVLGIAVGKLYYYFRGKEELLAFCQEDSLKRLLRVAETVSRTGLGPAERLHLQVVGHVRCLNEGSLGSLAHLEVPGGAGGVPAPIQALRDRYEATVRHLIAEGVEAGVFRAVDPKLAALAVLGAVNWTARWYRPEGRLRPRALGEAFGVQLVRGLLAEGVAFHPPEADGRLDEALREEPHD